jgi:hypothetical protein
VFVEIKFTVYVKTISTSHDDARMRTAWVRTEGGWDTSSHQTSNGALGTNENGFSKLASIDDASASLNVGAVQKRKI